MSESDSVPLEMPESEPLPYEEDAMSIVEIEEQPGNAYAFIWKLQMSLAIIQAQLKATERKLDEVVSINIAYLEDSGF